MQQLNENPLPSSLCCFVVVHTQQSVEFCIGRQSKLLRLPLQFCFRVTVDGYTPTTVQLKKFPPGRRRPLARPPVTAAPPTVGRFFIGRRKPLPSLPLGGADTARRPRATTFTRDQFQPCLYHLKSNTLTICSLRTGCMKRIEILVISETAPNSESLP